MLENYAKYQSGGFYGIFILEDNTYLFGCSVAKNGSQNQDISFSLHPVV
jgi:hypothetical protein